MEREMAMVMTYDFIIYAQRNEKFMQQIRECVQNKADMEFCIDIHRLHFNGKEKKVIVEPFSETSEFRHKIIIKEIGYEDLMKLLGGDWDSVDMSF